MNNNDSNKKEYIINKMIIFIKALIKSFIWTLLTSILGLLPIWMTIGISYFVKDIDFSFQSDVIVNGSFLFFIMTIIAAITVDYFFVPSLPIPKWSEILVFFLYPFFIALFVGLSYPLLYIIPDRLEYSNIKNAQYVVALMTFIYSVFSKFVMFYTDELISKGKLKNV